MKQLKQSVLEKAGRRGGASAIRQEHDRPEEIISHAHL